MPLLVLLTVASLVGSLTAALVWRFAPGSSTTEVVSKVVSVGSHELPPMRAWLRRRRDPKVATGLMLSVAALIVATGTLLIAVLALLVRSNETLRRFDSGVARWGSEHSSHISDRGLTFVTDLGDARTLVVLGVVLVVVEAIRAPNRYILPFVLVTTLGNHLLTTGVKDLVDRARPTFNPVAQSLGPSFPSGHTSNAAAFYAVAALLLGRHLGHAPRAALAGGAVGLAVAVAASRVLLDVHWLSDVIAGLALGYAWFAACTIAFGGRLLRFGVAAEVARETAREPVSSEGPQSQALDSDV